MWLPKDERKLLRCYYQELGQVNVKGRFFLSKLAECLQGPNARNQAIIASETLDRRKLIILMPPQGDAITVGLTLEGYDLGKRYSSRPGTAWVWCNEYKVWIIVSVIIGLVTLVATILKD